MSLLNSFQQFKRINQEDRTLNKHGARRGWLIYHHYLGRFRNRLGLVSRELLGQFTIKESQVTFHVMPEQLGTLFGIIGDNEYDLSEWLINQPSTILDLGSNSGMAALYFHAHYPEARIACVEPDPRNIKLLQKTLTSNKLADAVTIFPAAVAASPGQLKLRMGPNSTCSSLESSPLHDLEDSLDVKVITVPMILYQLGWDRINLLKMDIEGTEDEVLSRDNGWLKQVDAIVLEIHPNTTPEKIQSYLLPFGFTLKPLLRGIEPVYFATKC